MSYRLSPGNGKGRKRITPEGPYLDEFLFCTWISKVHNNPHYPHFTQEYGNG